jgi:hypothetical protein
MGLGSGACLGSRPASDSGRALYTGLRSAKRKRDAALGWAF